MPVNLLIGRTAWDENRWRRARTAAAQTDCSWGLGPEGLSAVKVVVTPRHQLRWVGGIQAIHQRVVDRSAHWPVILLRSFPGYPHQTVV